ncbi:substrate-binding periplasmic protein [Fluviispira multicolorata]|uniref:Transporter substrate-binding domain-containing protein n=1 Tax=Fluviispira multicolorata TaxID=2654512 RepID=A0A833N5I4_9BACT|nr:transporter substrate-binding domain-containing protein [Fluviispira multicolorata]KAB8027986.1 transporter substrate-binding domain-containing protein [Fluviispira multicolorata]
MKYLDLIFKVYIYLFIFSAKFVYANKIIVTTQDWSPYQVSNNGKLSGITTDMVICIFKKMNKNYDIMVLPWARAQESVKNGKANAFYAAFVTSRRNKYAVPSNSLVEQNWLWVMKKNSKLDPDSKSFRLNTTIGVKFSTALEDFLSDNNYNITDRVKQSSQLIDMLNLGRFDALLTAESIFYNDLKIKKLSKSDFKIVFHSKNSLVFYFSKKYVELNPSIVETFNSYISVCREK